jgi:hypothetical protein
MKTDESLNPVKIKRAKAEANAEHPGSYLGVSSLCARAGWPGLTRIARAMTVRFVRNAQKIVDIRLIRSLCSIHEEEGFSG